MTESEKYRQEFFKAFEEGINTTNPIPIIIITHLYTEYWINRLIEEKSPTPKEILDDHRGYTYAVKLNLVYNMQLISKELYQNLKKLNDLRNKYAHKIGYDFLKSNFDYYDPNNKIDVKAYAELLRKGKSKMKPLDVLVPISFLTAGWLERHCKETYKMKT